MESMDEDKDFIARRENTKFAKEMVLAFPSASLEQVMTLEFRDTTLFNRVANGWLRAFSAHPRMGDWTSSFQSYHHHSTGENSAHLILE